MVTTRPGWNARTQRWLGWLTVTLGALLAASLAGSGYASYRAGAPEVLRELSRLAAAVEGGGLSAAREALPALAEGHGWLAVAVVNPDGLIVAAHPPFLAGNTLPDSGSGLIWPGASRWDRWDPGGLRQLLGLPSGPDQPRVLGYSAGRWRLGGDSAYLLYAVVDQPRWLGLTAGAWNRGLESAGLALFAATALALAAWVYRDARRRELDAPAWGALALVTSVVGWATYLAARSRQDSCPGCGRPVKPLYRGCPYCGVQLRPACPSCGRGVHESWSFCAHCTEPLH